MIRRGFAVLLTVGGLLGAASTGCSVLTDERPKGLWNLTVMADNRYYFLPNEYEVSAIFSQRFGVDKGEFAHIDLPTADCGGGDVLVGLNRLADAKLGLIKSCGRRAILWERSAGTSDWSELRRWNEAIRGFALAGDGRNGFVEIQDQASCPQVIRVVDGQLDQTGLVISLAGNVWTSRPADTSAPRCETPGVTSAPQLTADARMVGFFASGKVGAKRQWSLVVGPAGAARYEARPEVFSNSTYQGNAPALALLPDASGALIAGEYSGNSGLWRIDFKSGAVKKLKDGLYLDVSITPDATGYAAARRDKGTVRIDFGNIQPS